MNRREFMKLQAAGLAALAVGGPAMFASPGRLSAQELPDVAVVKGSPAAATRRAVELVGGLGRFVKPGQKVVIKPNMSFARTPEAAANTHPEVVRELLVMCREARAGQVRVLDHSLQDPRRALEQSGILDACRGVEENICFHLMDDEFYQETSLPDGVEMKSNAVMREVLAADVIIACPVAKSHGGAGVSLSLKGQMGLIYDRRSMHSRYNLDVAIADLNTLLRPRLTVIDATRVLSSGGPGGPGRVLTPGEVIASADPLAADATAVAAYEWYGRKIEPRQVAHLAEAARRGLGRMDLENLRTARVTV